MSRNFGNRGGSLGESGNRAATTSLTVVDEEALEGVAGAAGSQQVELNPPSSVDAWAPPALPEISGPPQRLDWYAVTL